MNLAAAHFCAHQLGLGTADRVLPQLDPKGVKLAVDRALGRLCVTRPQVLVRSERVLKARGRRAEAVPAWIGS